MRINRYLARTDIGSRRKAEDLIRAGRVRVGGVVAKLGQQIEHGDEVSVDGKVVYFDPRKVYLMLNKPPGYVTTKTDPQNRPTVFDLIGVESDVHAVGRLDFDAEGLLLLTNDGDLTNRLTHPSFEVPKTYVVDVKGQVTGAALRHLLAGVGIDGGRPAKAVSARVLETLGRRTLVEITVHEGRKHVVKLMMASRGWEVRRLVRVAVGPVKMGRLARGTYRKLDAGEVESLREASGIV